MLTSRLLDTNGKFGSLQCTYFRTVEVFAYLLLRIRVNVLRHPLLRQIISQIYRTGTARLLQLKTRVMPGNIEIALFCPPIRTIVGEGMKRKYYKKYACLFQHLGTQIHSRKALSNSPVAKVIITSIL